MDGIKCTGQELKGKSSWRKEREPGLKGRGNKMKALSNRRRLFNSSHR